MKELVTIQAELKAPKNQLNKFGGYNYRSAEDILEAVKPLLKKAGCTLTMSDEVLAIGPSSEAMSDEGVISVPPRYYVRATATLTNGSGESVSVDAYAREAESKKGMDDAQVTGSASSYARKYALNGLFAIDDSKDIDSIDNTSRVDEAVKEMERCTTREAMISVWEKYKDIQGDPKMRDAAARIGAKFKK